jgi:hypothetical protein
MKPAASIFTSAMIAAGVVLTSAHAQSLIATNRIGNYVPSPPVGQMPSSALTNRPALTGKRPLPPRLHLVSPFVVKPTNSVDALSLPQTVRLQQPIPQPQSIASAKPTPPETPSAQQK